MKVSDKQIKDIVLDIILAVDYDIWKVFADPENSEDPAASRQKLKYMTQMVRDWLGDVEGKK